MLKAAGLKVAPVDGWQSRGRGDVGQIMGILCHHTAGPKSGNMPSLNILINGRPDLPGPLAQLGLGRDGTYFVIAAGKCNHAGKGSWKGVTNGNTNFIGIEAENCLEAGTSVLTKTGLMPIEKVPLGMDVWTHQNRWRPVIGRSVRKDSEALLVKAAGHPGIRCSPHHQWYGFDSYCGINRTFDHERWLRQEHKIEWAETANMAGRLMVSPVGVAPLEPEPIAGIDITPELLWIAGRWVADGSREHHKIPVIAVRDSKADVVRQRLKQANLKWSEYGHLSSSHIIYFRIPRPELGDWLAKEFGRISIEHTIPAWLLSASGQMGKAFLDGYLHGDGFLKRGGKNKLGGISRDRIEVGTSSRCLAFGIRLLAQALGMYAIVSSSRMQYPDGHIIAGRATKQSAPSWIVSLWNERPFRGHLQRHEEWSIGPVRSVQQVAQTDLYDLTVADDHSFIADGMVTHNCGTPVDPWPEAQMDAYHRGVAAILKHIGRGVEFCAGHKEYALPKGRKSDPNFDMNLFRSSVAAIMGGTAPAPDLIPAAEPPSPSGAAGRPTLRRGATGELVRQVQAKVGVGVDGNFGPKTEAAVRNFQGANGLVPDGIIGPQTWQALDGVALPAAP